MAGSFSQELEDLLNPQPKFADPEDDGDETTTARVIDTFAEDDDGEEVGLSVLRRSNTALLSDIDRRYVGKAVSRKQLMNTERSDEEDEPEDDEDDEPEDDEEEEPEDDEEEEEEGSNAQLNAKLSAKANGCDVSCPQGVDFHRLTEGMDDLGVSEDEEGDNEESEDESPDDSEGESPDDEDEGTICTLSKQKVNEEVEKGMAVKSQLALWDQLLEGRIKAQKVLVTANKLPQPQTFPEFKKRGGAELAAVQKNTHKALKALQRSLLELHDQLLYQNPDTRTIAVGQTGAPNEEEIDSDEDGEGSVQEREVPKRKLDMADYPDFMAKRFAAFQPYRDTMLQKWHDRTRLSMGKSSRGFGAFDRNILTQVEQVLRDRERLVRRTQTRRSEYTVLGKITSKTVPPEGEEAEPHSKANTHLKDVDKDIFDDDDFYHQLLRELIERKTSTSDPNDQVAMGRQWLAIQKLCSKVKKKVDTKASKGRKVRFHIHSKLANFMAPIDHSSMSDEACSELYRGLFGQKSSVRE